MRKLLAALAAATLASCSVYPFPDDVSRVPTEEIVRNLLCEVKDAVRNEIVSALATNLNIRDIAPEDVLLGKNLERIARVASEGDPRRGARVASKFLLYAYLNIAFAFEFEIDEDDNATITALNFVRPLTNGGTFSLNADAGLDKKRHGKRTFRRVQTFIEFADLDCSERVVHHRNIIYPITGKIGMDKVIHTFIWLNEPGPFEDVPDGPCRSDRSDSPYCREKPMRLKQPMRLGMGNEEAARDRAALEPAPMRTAQAESPTKKKGDKKKDDAKKATQPATKPAKKKGEASATRPGATIVMANVAATGVFANPDMFVDELEFTTTWKAGLNPKLELNPVGRGLRLKTADVDLGVQRKDRHKVTISLAFPDKEQFALTSYADLQFVRNLNARQKIALSTARNQAALNLCIAIAQKREEEFGTLRFSAPEQYCRDLYTPRPGVAVVPVVPPSTLPRP